MYFTYSVSINLSLGITSIFHCKIFMPSQIETLILVIKKNSALLLHVIFFLSVICDCCCEMKVNAFFLFFLVGNHRKGGGPQDMASQETGKEKNCSDRTLLFTRTKSPNQGCQKVFKQQAATEQQLALDLAPKAQVLEGQDIQDILEIQSLRNAISRVFQEVFSTAEAMLFRQNTSFCKTGNNVVEMCPS